MGYGNKSVSGVHPILKHMNKLGGNPEIKYDPIAHDEKGMGRGGKLGTAEYGKMKDGMPAYGTKSEGMPKHGYHDKGKGMPKHGKIHKKDTGKGYSVMTDSKGVKVNIKNK